MGASLAAVKVTLSTMVKEFSIFTNIFLSAMITSCCASVTRRSTSHSFALMSLKAHYIWTAYRNCVLSMSCPWSSSDSSNLSWFEQIFIGFDFCSGQSKLLFECLDAVVSLSLNSICVNFFTAVFTNCASFAALIFDMELKIFLF